MKRNRRAPRVALQFEPLEDRLALAGNVTAAIKSGSLVATGDDVVNQFDIVSSSPTQFRVTGLNGTRINTPDPNDPNPLFEVVFNKSALTKDVKIDLKKALDAGAARADSVGLDGLFVPGKLDIKGKNG